MGTTKIKSPQIGQCLSHTYLSHTNVYISSDLGDAFSDYVGGFLDLPGNSWDNGNYCRTPGTLTLFWRLSVYPEVDFDGQEKY